MTPQTAAALRALVENWRAGAQKYLLCSATNTYLDCADELAAVLTQEGVELHTIDFDQWFNASKYMQVVYSPDSRQPALDGWNAALARAAPAEPRAGAGTGEMPRCPFCHSANTGIASDDPEETTGYVKCHGCGARGPVACDNEAIVASWNRRAAAAVPAGGDAVAWRGYWLIERGSPAEWLTFKQHPYGYKDPSANIALTRSSHEALQFAREVDARMFMQFVYPCNAPVAEGLEYRVENHADEVMGRVTEGCSATECVECDRLRERLSDLLTRTVNVLRGEPKPLHLHSWHDIPDLAAALVAENKRLVAASQLRNGGHSYWGAGEPDCPKEIKGDNGELHTLMCKRCGQTNPRGLCAGYTTPAAQAQDAGPMARHWREAVSALSAVPINHILDTGPNLQAGSVTIAQWIEERARALAAKEAK